MPSKCPACQAIAVDEEQGGELVCHECGAVAESRVLSFESDSKNGWTFMSANGTARFDGRYELPTSIRQRLPTGDSTATKKLRQECLSLLVKRMNLSNEILKQARVFLFNTVTPKIKSREIQHISRHRNILVASCLLIVCRQNNIQLSYRRMAEIAECNMFALGKSVKAILKALNIQLDPVGVESTLLNVLSLLSVTDKSCKELCLDLWHIFKYFSLIEARNYAAAASALVLLVLECKAIKPSKEKIAEVRGKHSLTKGQLEGQVKSTRNSLLELAKEVPWIPKSVKRPIIARHIIDIVNFHKQFVKLDLSSVKSVWMKKKEATDKKRKVKIQMAKARLLDKEQQQKECSSSECSSSGESNSHHHILLNSVLSHQEKDEEVVLQSGITSSTQTVGSGANSSDVFPGIHDNSCARSSSDLLTSCSDKDLDHNDILIENLLKSGFSEEELMDGYFESRMCNLQSSQCDPEGEREDLDELDIDEGDMHHYLWSVAEVEQIRNLKSDRFCQ